MKHFLVLALLCALVFSTACTQSPQKLVAAGNRYHDKRKYTEASILYQKAITKDKTYAEAYYREGLNLLDMGEPVNAAKFLRRAVDLQPTNTDAAMKLSEIYLSAYSADPRKFKSLLPEVRDLDAKILRDDPNSFDGLRLQGLLALAENDRDKALETFAKANQIKPHSPELVWWYAEALSGAGRGQEAEALVRDMLAHDPKWARGYDFLFLMYARVNDRQKAETVLRERVRQDPSSVVATENLANYLLANNRYPEAEATIKPLLQDKKKFPSGHQAVGDFYFRAKKYDQALQQYQQGLKEDSKNKAQYNQRIIGIYEAMGRNDDALRLAKQMAEEDPKNTAANELYAGLLLRTGTPSNINKSLSELKVLVQNSPTDGLLHLDLARVYFATNQPDRALTEALDGMQYEAKSKTPRTPVLTMSRLIAARIYEDRGQHAKAIEQTSMILQIDPKNADARLIRDRAQIASNNVRAAEPDLQALVQEAPGINDAHLQLANLYLNEKQFDKASAEFDKVWKMNPPDVRGFIGLQTVSLAQGKGEEAIRAVDNLLQQHPNDLNLRYELATFQSAVGARAMASDPDHGKQLLQSAADNYKQILKTNSNSADVWLRLGAVQRQLGQVDAALASFEQAGNADPHNAVAPLNQALLLEAVGKKKEASAAYNKVLGIDPENPLALNNLAYMNAETGTNLDQAMTFAQRAKQRVPNSPDISDTLGFVYYQKNLNAEALQIFKQVVQQNPQNSTFRLHLAMALEKQGNKQAARDEAQKALKISSQPDQRDKIRSFLDQLG